MKNSAISFSAGRRNFLKKTLPAGTLFCLGCSGLPGQENVRDQQKSTGQRHKFLDDSGMSFQEVFEFAYRDFSKLMHNLGKWVGKEKVIDLLKRDSEEWGKQETEKELSIRPANDFSAFRAEVRKKPNRFWEHVITSVIVEDSDRAIEKRITECLLAKIFREADAADIGYAYSCHGDFASARAFNPKLKLVRTKTLMLGDDCCNARWVWEG